MTAPLPHRRRSAAVALAAVLVACAAVALTQSPNQSPQRLAPTPAPTATAAPEPAPSATTPPGRRGRRRATDTPPRERPSPSGGSDAPTRVAPGQRRRARAARRIAASFARAWTRYTGQPGDRRAAQAVKATSTPWLWRQLRQVRSTAGGYQPADRYSAIAGVSVPLSGQRLEVTIELRDRAGRRQYLTVLAAPTEAGWKITEIVL